MSSQIIRKLFTIDDCYKMAEVGILAPDERTELINGEILIMPPPGPRHGFVVDNVNESRCIAAGRRVTASIGRMRADDHEGRMSNESSHVLIERL